MQPFPQEAERLGFTIESISALKNDGTELPLSLSLSELRGSMMRRQRLAASGALTPGLYSGLLFKIGSASLRTEEGEAALLVPEEPVMIPYSFEVRKKRALVLSLSFKYAESIKGVSFSPVFFVFIPEKPLTGLTGLVSNYGSHTITVFDKKKQEVTGVISTGNGPKGIALDQTSGRAYVALSGEDGIEVIDITAGDVIGRIRLSRGDNPQESALTPDGKILLTADAGSNTVSVIDTASLLEVSRLSVGGMPRSVVIDRTGRRAYVFNTLSNTISVIDIPTRLTAATIAAESEPLRGQFNRAGDRLYVIHGGSPYLSITDPFSLSVVRKEFVGLGANSIKVDARTDLFYLGKKNDAEVAVYNPFSFAPIDYIRAMGAAGYITIDGEENNLYLVMPEKKSVLIVNLISNRIVSEIDVGEYPYWVTMMGER